MPSIHLILCCALLLLPSIFPSIRVFSSESVLHIRWPKFWSFSLSISPSNEYSGLISFRIDWLDLLAVQGTLWRVLLQHHSSKASILRHSAFSYPYITTGKTTALTRWTFVGKVINRTKHIWLEVFILQKCIGLKKFPKIHSKLKSHLFYVKLLAYLTITGVIILVLYACKI